MAFRGYNKTWSEHPEFVDRVVYLWDEWGSSASQIARDLGHGITRNAVIGKIKRLRDQGIIKRKVEAMSPAKPPKLKPVVVKVVLPPPNEPMPIGLHDDFPDRQLDGTCRYPHGDPSVSWHLCGHLAFKDTSWCEYHHSRLLVKPLVRVR